MNGCTEKETILRTLTS